MKKTVIAALALSLASCSPITRDVMMKAGTYSVSPSPIDGASHRIKILEVRSGKERSREMAREFIGWEGMKIIQESEIDSGLGKPFIVLDVARN